MAKIWPAGSRCDRNRRPPWKRAFVGEVVTAPLAELANYEIAEQPDRSHPMWQTSVTKSVRPAAVRRLRIWRQRRRRSRELSQYAYPTQAREVSYLYLEVCDASACVILST